MRFKSLNIEECINHLEALERCDDGFIKVSESSKLSTSEKEFGYNIRKFLPVSKKLDSSVDTKFAFELYYNILSLKNGFSLRHASNDGIWRNLSCRVAPDVIDRRWRKKDGDVYILNIDRFYKISSRSWFKSLWWYCHIVHQENIDHTMGILKLSTADTIAQTVERTSKGYNLEILRRLFLEAYNFYNNNENVNFTNLIRKVMKIHLLKSATIDPKSVYDSGKSYFEILIN